MTYLLIGVSLILAILGTFTKTFESGEEQGRSKVWKVTPWGYLVALFLMISAIGSGVNTYIDAEKQKKNDELNHRALSQQRLLALASLGSAYTKEGPLYITIRYWNDIDAQKHPEDHETFYEKHKNFPGFGIPISGYELSLEPSEGSHTAYLSGKLGEIPEMNRKDSQLTYDIEISPADVSHIWMIPGYHSLDEILFDFQSEREIGTLTIWKAGGAFTTQEIDKLKKMLSEDYCDLSITCFLRKKGANLRRVHLDIPVSATATHEGDKLSFTLQAGDPRVGSIAFTPF